MAVKITIWGKYIAADIPFTYGRDARKDIPGSKAQWDRTVEPHKFKFWSYPLSMATCRAFRVRFGKDLVISASLQEWAWDQRRAEEELEKLRAGQSVDMPYVRQEAPKLWEAMQARPFQITGANFVSKSKRVCLGDEPRLGKTYQALAALVEHGGERVLIACPRTATRTVWGRKIDELLGEQAFVAQGDRYMRERIIKEFDKADGPKFLVINMEMIRVVRKYQCPDGTENRVRPGKNKGCQEDHNHTTVYYPEYPELFDQPWDGIVLDESHNVLASSKNQLSDNIPQIRLGAMRLHLADDGMKIASSGTPWKSSLDRTWGTLNWLWPERFGSYWKYAEQMFGVKQDRWGGYQVGKKPISDKALQDALRPYYIARTKAEVAPQLLPIEYAGTYPSNPESDAGVGMYIGLDDKQLKAYGTLERVGLAKLMDGSVIMANGTLAEITRLKQFACAQGKLDSNGDFIPSLPSSKLDWILEFLEERKELTGKVVIVSQFTKIVNLFTAEIRKAGWEVVTITGESTDNQRTHAQDAFQNGSPRVAFINVYAGGEAIDLSAADEMIFVDEPWSAHNIQQAENRIQNLAKRQQLTIYRLRAEGTVDEWISELTEDQKENLLSGKVEALPQYASVSSLDAKRSGKVRA
jgi:SNF2 family DNA or RNA helicase